MSKEKDTLNVSHINFLSSSDCIREDNALRASVEMNDKLLVAFWQVSQYRD